MSRRHGKTLALARELRATLQSTPTHERAVLVVRSTAIGDRILATLDPHERERVDVSVCEHTRHPSLADFAADVLGPGVVVPPHMLALLDHVERNPGHVLVVHVPRRRFSFFPWPADVEPDDPT